MQINVQYYAPLLHHVKDKGIDSALLSFHTEGILLKLSVCVCACAGHQSSSML